MALRDGWPARLAWAAVSDVIVHESAAPRPPTMAIKRSLRSLARGERPVSPVAPLPQDQRAFGWRLGAATAMSVAATEAS